MSDNLEAAIGPKFEKVEWSEMTTISNLVTELLSVPQVKAALTKFISDHVDELVKVSVAERISDPVSKEMMLKVAAEYEQLARRAEERLKKGSPQSN